MLKIITPSTVDQIALDAEGRGQEGYSIYFSGHQAPTDETEWWRPILDRLDEDFSDSTSIHITVFVPTDTQPTQKEIKWRLHAQESSDIILHYFGEGKASVDTALELGLWANNALDTEQIVICSPKSEQYELLSRVAGFYLGEIFESVEDGLHYLMNCIYS